MNHGVPLLDWAHGGRMECVQIAKRNIDLFASPRSQNVILCFAPASQNGLKVNNTRLKHQSEQFWFAQKPTKGGGLLKRLAPLCRFFSSQNSSNCCLRSRILSFQSFLVCRGSQKLHFVDLGLTYTFIYIL